MENTWDINLNVTKRRQARNSLDLPLAESQPQWQAEANGSPSRGEKKISGLKEPRPRTNITCLQRTRARPTMPIPSPRRRNKPASMTRSNEMSVAGITMRFSSLLGRPDSVQVCWECIPVKRSCERDTVSAWLKIMGIDTKYLHAQQLWPNHVGVSA